MDLEQCGVPALIIGLVTLVVMILTCWSTVDVTFYGLKCNTFSKKCNVEDIYDSGRYFTGPFNYFVQFPGTLQTIKFSESDPLNKPLQTRTAEGLSLVLHVSFQYQLRKQEIEKLYQMNNLQYEQTFVKIARDIILQVAGSYQAASYWSEKQKIVDDVKTQLNRELQKAYADVPYFAILLIDLPDPFEESIVLTQVETQKKKTKEFEKQAAQIQQEIEVMSSENNSKIKFISAQAQADAYNIKQEAEAEFIKLTLGAEQKAYNTLKKQCNFNNEELNNFIYYSSLMTKNNSTDIFVGVNEVIADARSK